VIGAAIFIALVAVLVAVLGVVYFDVPERKRWASEAKRPIQYRLPGF
jgi:hypothetical protein